MQYPFTQDEMETAIREWGCNCGPAALAFALQRPLAEIRYAIPGFAEKRYTSPTMMKGGLEFFKVAWSVVTPSASRPPDIENLFDEMPSLVRVQFTGPWTKPGSNPKWAYNYTHWVATWRERSVPLVFDINGGAMGILSWDEVLAEIARQTPRADGGWFPTHIWRIPGSSA